MTKRRRAAKRLGWNEEGPQAGATVLHSAREDEARADALGYLAATRARSAT